MRMQTQRPGLRPILASALVLGLLAVAFAVVRKGENRGPVLRVISGRAMGTAYQVKCLVPRGDARRVDRARFLERDVAEALEAVEARMSAYRSDSDLSRFNAHSDTTPFPVSLETLEVLQLAQIVSERSDGAFDITVAPLVNVFGFGPDTPTSPVLDGAALETLRAAVGYRLLTLDARAGTVAKARPDVRCDLAAIAKGYGVDKTAEALELAGIRDYMVEVGGEVRARGLNPRGQPWRIGIEEPLDDRRAVRKAIALRDRAMATSGDYRNFRVESGTRVSHTIDPRTGRPIAHDLASVTVVHERCALADAWATALNVLGPVEGPDIAEKEGLAALFVVRNRNGSFREVASTAFRELEQGEGAKP